jgi:FtsP/CotA-like multicopper oxidase with cupredoxin domain
MRSTSRTSPRCAQRTIGEVAALAAAGAALAALASATLGCGDGEPAGTTVPQGVTRRYFVAAEPVTWDYAPSGIDMMAGGPLPSPWGDTRSYEKLRYVEYTDDTFSKEVPAPAWRGLLGPVLHASVGDTIEVVFENHADRPLSMHPHGVRYDAASEGASHGDGHDEHHGIAPPGGRVVYVWVADAASGPSGPDAPSSKVWLYHSHVDANDEIYRGLVGTIVVTDPARANADGSPADVDAEFVALFMVANENQPETPESEQEGHLKHAINYRIFANLEGLEMRAGQQVRWYLVALGTEVDLHTAHFHGETVTTELGESTDVIELLPASMRTVDMFPDNPGRWMLHCHVADHVVAGMTAWYDVL